MPNAPTLSKDRRPPIRETPIDWHHHEDLLLVKFEQAIAAAVSASPSRGRQQISRRRLTSEGHGIPGFAGPGCYWIVQDIR